MQRRHQKVVEETPSVALTPALRARMGEAAVRVANAAGYTGAGTVEFLVEGAGDAAPFYFLEVNARLQVEHPITEEVAGVDLVRAQIGVAAGEPLPWSQAEIGQRGHAIEVRLYAEDPAQGYLPAGRARSLLYREPSMPGVRVDSGVSEGSEVSVHYDPLLAKLVARGETRDAARRRALAALRRFRSWACAPTRRCSSASSSTPGSSAATLDTHFLEQEHEVLADEPRRTGPTWPCAGRGPSRRPMPPIRATPSAPRASRTHGIG